MKPVLHCVRLWLLQTFVAVGTAFLAGNSVAQPGYADLALSFNNTSAFAASTGQYFKCSINLYNGGWETATNTTITNWLPAGLEFVSATISRGTCSQSAGSLTCALGDLPPYQSATLTMEFKAIAIGSYTNVAVAASATPDPNSTNSQASFITLVTQARFFGVGGTHIAFYSTPTMTLMTNNQVLVVGQHLGKTTDLYNMSSRTFSLAAGTPVGVHEYGSATVLTNGLVLLAGGATATGTKTAELYNPATQLFHQVGDMLVYSYGHYATLQPDGTVVLCGGALTTNELFNPVTETFSLAPTKQCAFNGIYLSTGKFLYFGYGRAYLYDTNTSTSVETSGFLQPRAYHTATLLQNGKVLIAGGYGTWGAVTGPLSSAELYDPITDTFTRTANLTGPREHHSACLLPDGTVLLAGGMTSESDPFSLTTAEVHDPNGTINVPGVGVSDTSIVEGDSGTNRMQFTVWLTTTSALPVTVNFATAAGTAGTVDWGVANVDFANTNGTLTFSPGQTSAIVSVPIFGDLIREPNETLTLNLRLPVQAWIARAVATGTIMDNDPMPVLAVSPAALIEGDLARSNMSLQISLSLPTTSTVTVDYMTADQTATAASDYLPVNGSLTFGPGTTSLTVEVPVLGDLDSEGDETFLLNLSNTQNAVIGVASALGTILNDDAVPGRLHHFDWSVISGPLVQAAGFPVTITARDYFGDVATNVPWPVRLSGQTTNYAATNLDFEAPTLAPWTTFNYTPFEKTFDQRLADVSGLGPASMAFRMSANGGTNGIAQEIFLVGGIPYTFSANILIKVDDVGQDCSGGVLHLHIGTNSTSTVLPVMCFGQVRTKISLSYTPPTNGIYPLRFTTSRPYWLGEYYWVYLDDVQISYPVVTPTVATNFINGVWTGVVTSHQAGTNFSLRANDNAGHVGASNPFNVLPGADLGLSASTNWPATLRTGDRLTFNLAVTNRGPSAAGDAVLRWIIPTNLTFLSSSNLQGTITNEGGQLKWTIGSLAVGSNVNASVVMRADIPGLFTNAFTLTNSVIDVNPSDNLLTLPAQVNPPLLAISDASATEATGAAAGIVFAVTLSGPSGQTVSVDYLTLDGTATNNFDFASTNGTVTFLPGTTNRNIVIKAFDDILDEPNRSFSVQLTNVVNAAFGDAVGLGTILDDDAPPVIGIADTNIVEGDLSTKNISFRLTLSKPAIVDVTVRCSTTAGTAETNDFTMTTTTVTFPAGTTNTTFSVPIRGNTVNEPDETFAVALTLPTNATIGRSPATGTILNDDAVPGRLDHFSWDAIPSPRFTSWPFPVTLRAVDYLGNPATNTSIAALVSARTENGFFIRVAEDFEDGDSVGWTNYITTFTSAVTNETSANGNNSLRLTGGSANTTAGLRRTFTNGMPNKISFAVRVGRTNQIAGRFTTTVNGNQRSVVFYCNNNGQMGLLDRTLGFRGVPYQSNRWYQVSLSLNWASQKIDCWIDGALALTNITFPDTIATSMDSVVLANQDNTTSWWDDIRVFNDNVTDTFTVAPGNFVSFANGAKSNLVTISGAATNVYLTADDGSEHVGSSGYFNLLPVPLSLATTSSVTEGSSPGPARVGIPVPFPQPITVALTSTLPARLSVPASVIIPANQTNATFNLTVVDDALLNGTELVSVIATVPNFVSATNVVAVQDNEPAILTLTLPAIAAENAGTLAGQGQVTSSASPSKPIAIALASSDTNVVQVPASVTIPSNQTSASFDIVIVNNQRLDGPHAATISTSVANMTNDSRTITVTDDETANLRVLIPAFVNEGGSASVSVHLTGSLNTNVTINLSSSDTNALVAQPASMVPAGQTSAVFSVTAPDNALFDGTRIVTLAATAPGFISAITNVSVTDNELHHFDFSAIASLQQGSVGFSLTLTARDINNVLMAAYSTNVALSAVDGASNSVPLTPATVGLVNGQWTGTVTVPGWEFQNVRVIAKSGGVSNASSLFDVVAPTLSVVNVTGSDLAYSPLNGRLYVNNTSGLTPINPLQSQVETSVNIGSLGTRMTISDDGQFIYLERTNGNLCRFNVTSNVADLFWSSGAPQIEDMAAVPGWPTAVAVSRMNTAISPRTLGTVVYNNGVALPNSGGGNVIEFASSLPRLYIYNSEGGCGVGMYDVNTNGLTPVRGFSWACYPGNFVGRGGLLFMGSGEILHSERFILVGSHSSGTAVGGDESEGRCYLWQYGGSQSSIATRDLHTLLPIGSTDLPAVTSAAGSLIRWGTNGLAFRINGSQIAIVRSRLVPSGQNCDLVLSRVSASGPAFVGDNFTCTYAISNAGPGRATNVAFTATLPATASLVSIGSTNGPCAAISGGVVCNVPSLSAGATALVTVTLSPTKPGPMALKVGVLSGALDPNLTNNRLTIDVPAMFVGGYDSVVELALTANDLVYDAARGRICASVPNGNELIGNSIVTFDPQSGYYSSLIPTAVEPGKLAVADNGQYLYTSVSTETAIQRIDLNTRVADLKFPTGYNGVHDMEVMPGNAAVVAATVHTTVVIYENGVPRPNVVGPTEYNFPYSLEFGGSSNRLYASFPWGFRRINVGNSGASLIEDVRDTLIVGYTYDMDFGSGLVYSINGRVFNPETKTMITTLPYTGLVIAGPPSGYAFFLTTSGSTATLHVIDMPTRTEIKSISISGISGSAASFMRWGNDGFAFRTTGGQVFLVRSTIADDQDRDGLADSWELAHFGSLNAPNGEPGDDPDHDGFSNADEFRLGLDPLAFDAPRLLSCKPRSDGSVQLTALVQTVQTYALFASVNLVDWVPLQTFTGSNSIVTLTDPDAIDFKSRFYRFAPLSAAIRP